MAKYKLTQKTDANGTTQDIVLDASSVDLSNYVQSSRTINSKALSSNITLSASDVKALPNYSLSISTGAGNPREVRFVRVNYSTFDGNNAGYFRIGAMCSHGNGSSYTFLEDIIIGVSATPSVTCTIYKQVQNASTYTIDSHSVHFGDVYWVVDTTNKYVDFYIICGQYATINFTPFMRIGATISDTSKIVQYTGGATLYSSGTRVWDATGNGSLYARTSDLAGKQDTLVSGTNIKTINNESILGSGNITISGGGDMTNVAKTNVDNNFSTGQTISGNCKASAFTSDSSGCVIRVSDGNEISFGMNGGNAIYFGYDNRTSSTAVPSMYNFGNGTGSAGATSGTIQCGSVVEGGIALSSKYQAKLTGLNLTYIGQTSDSGAWWNDIVSNAQIGDLYLITPIIIVPTGNNRTATIWARIMNYYNGTSSTDYRDVWNGGTPFFAGIGAWRKNSYSSYTIRLCGYSDGYYDSSTASYVTTNNGWYVALDQCKIIGKIYKVS